MERRWTTFAIAIATGVTPLTSVQVSFGENSLRASQQKQNPTRILERLTLLLVDRLPTLSEREAWMSRGKHSIVQLADQLVASPEFFHRQALYWQTQLNKSPAWKWEGLLNPYELNLSTLSAEKKRQLLWYTAPTQSSSLARSCTGVWTIASDNDSLAPCSCDEAIDLLPFWDKASSMRVCPAALKENRCGPSLELCFPVDRRLSPSAPELEMDRDTAGGLAIDRLLTDLNLANGRALALKIINHQKWSQLPVLPFRTAMSRSSIALMEQWNRILRDELSTQLSQSLKFSENSEQLEQSFAKSSAPPKRIYGFKALALSSAETFLVSDPQSSLLTVRPLRFSSLSESVWNWNSDLIFTCNTPLVAQQQFQLPLPHPDKAKNASYFCSGCHMELDAQMDRPKNQVEQTTPPQPPKTVHSECAVNHALQFLLGSSVSEFQSTRLKELGKTSFKTHGESLSRVIRDLAIDLAGSPAP